MGIIIGKFRKKKSTMAVLEKLESEITSIEEFSRDTEVRRKRIIRRFILLAVLTYLLLALVLYFFSHKFSESQNYIYVIPLVAFPIIVYLIKNFLAWYYSRKLRKNEQKLVKLKEEKKMMLNNVMETETYKVAKEILDKFGTERKSLMPKDSTPLDVRKKLVDQRSSQMTLRQRNVGLTPFNVDRPGSSRLPLRTTETPVNRAFSSSSIMTPRVTPSLTVTPIVRPDLSTPRNLDLPRPLLPNDRSILDKMVDYLVGDGPSNRFALICKNCYCHNGMAFKEEFEYLSFRCVYCSHFNPAPKKRLSRPNFDSPTQTRRSSDDSENSEEASGPENPEIRSDSPDTEKNSDFDKLSDLETKEEVPRQEETVVPEEEEEVPRESSEAPQEDMEVSQEASDHEQIRQD